MRLHQPATECFACKGKGYFFTSRKDRMAKRAAGAARKQAKVATAQAAFIEQHPGLIERLRKEAEWNSFAGEMLQKFNQWQSLTDRQIAACAAMFAKIDAKRAEKQAAKSASTGEVNIAAIEAMFSKARDSGLAPEPIKGLTRKQWRGLEHGLAFTREQFDQVTRIDHAEWKAEMALHSELFTQLSYHLPEALKQTKAKIEERLAV